MKKTSIVILILVVILLILATFMITHIVDYVGYEKKLAQISQNNSTDTSEPADTSKPSDTGSAEKDPEPSGSSAFIRSVMSKLEYIDSMYRENYVYKLDDEKLTDAILSAYVEGAGDEFGSYYNTETYEEVQEDFDAEFSGIGVSVIYNTDYDLIEIINVLPDSPALEAGLMPGDLIYKVITEDGVEYVEELGYYPTIGKLRGPEGTIAEFSVLRGEEGKKEEIEFKITRRKVTEVTVTGHPYELDPTVGIVRLAEFDSKTPYQFVEVVNDLLDSGCTKLVFDVRNNPGGELTSICLILDALLPEGPVIRLVDRDGNIETAYTSDENELDVPMAVVCNGSTASAAELFTAALKDYNKATIVGTTTYGKGCMQTMTELPFGGAISITTRLYNPPFSDNYHGIGVEPDVVVEAEGALLEKNFYKVTDTEDNQLAAAVATFSK